ncbi:MAG: hypothetical protein CMJ20_01905 [Phycisphaeraceae bacterium]|nr:hypothetical protein [Phycisphaeraceae bacterium]|tara:strand:+ start:1136 stop:1321 length:186 start_codon:yes stop_codon:yes gene_type:complete
MLNLLTGNQVASRLANQLSWEKASFLKVESVQTRSHDPNAEERKHHFFCKFGNRKIRYDFS